MSDSFARRRRLRGCRWPSTPPPRRRPRSRRSHRPRRQTTPATPPRPTPRDAAAAGKGALDARDDPFPSTYKAPASPPFAIRNVTLLTAPGPSSERHDPRARRKIVAVAPRSTCRQARSRDRCGRQVRHAGHHRRPARTSASTPRRHAGGRGRQRDDEAEYGGGVGEHCGVAAGPAVPAQSRGGVTTIQVLPGRRTCSAAAARC